RRGDPRRGPRARQHRLHMHLPDLWPDRARTRAARSRAGRLRESRRRGHRCRGRGAAVLTGADEPDFDPRADVYEFPRPRPAAPAREEGSQIIPSQDLTRNVDDWGRSEAFFKLVEPVLDFYYRYW